MRITLPFLKSTTVPIGASVSAPLPLPRMLMRPRPTTRSPRSWISGYSAWSLSKSSPRSRKNSRMPSCPIHRRLPFERHQKRRVPLDLGVEYLDQGLDVSAVTRLEAAPHDLHVLLRHRPRSISLWP